MPGAYYNEIDPYAAQWLRNLIAAGHIAAGDVDERSIRDVAPDDLRGYAQCHFFAGIGVWSHALRSAGWDDARPVWTGSCPCQPFSAAGKRTGTADDRHLWPEFFRLIQAVRPVVVFGEQVASADGLAWLDVVHADLESAGYACGAVDLCAAGFGAPHIRQRLFFVADSRRELQTADGGQQGTDGIKLGAALGNSGRGGSGGGELADAEGGNRGLPVRERGSLQTRAESERSGKAGVMAHALPAGRPEGWPVAWGGSAASGCGAGWDMGDPDDAGLEGRELPEVHPGGGRDGERSAREAGATNGFWGAADWLPCIDGKARPVEPGTFPLAHGIAGRVGRLRAYGNAIVAPVAAEFIRAFRECRP